MNCTPAPNDNTAQFVTTCLHTLRATMSAIQPDDMDSGKQGLAALRNVAFTLAKHIVSLPDDEVQKLACHTALHGDFLIIKLAIQTGLSSQEHGLIEAVKQLYKNASSINDFYRALTLARLLIVSSHTTHTQSWHSVPRPCLENFVAYQLERTPLILPEDGKLAVKHQEQALQSLLNFITSPDTLVADRNMVVELFLHQTTPLYFSMSDYDVLPIMVLTNKIMRFIFSDVIKVTTPLDYPFPPRKAHGKIRIGVFIKTLLAGGETIAMLNNIRKLDRSKYHITLINTNFSKGHYSEINFCRELFQAVDDIIKIDPNASIDKSVSTIRSLELDIFWHQTSPGLMDVGAFGYLFLYKLARIQCLMSSMHGYTTGNPFFDYFIDFESPFDPSIPRTDVLSEKEITFSNISIYIPDNWQHEANRVVTKESLNIPHDAIIYSAGAAAAKYTTECVTAWFEIIKAVPNSYLLLCPLNPGWYPTPTTILAFHSIVQTALEKTGVSPDRVRIINHVNGEAIALMHKWGDVHLSSFPYGGVLTLSDALRGGLCPVCIAGKTNRGNGNASIMKGYGLKDLIARDEQEYINLGIRFGTDAAFRAETKARVKAAYTLRNPLIKEEVADTYANVIERITEMEFPEVQQDAVKTA